MPEGVESEAGATAGEAAKSFSAASLARCNSATTTASAPREQIPRACSSVSVGPSGISHVVLTLVSWPILKRPCHIPITHFHKDQLHSEKMLPISKHSLRVKTQNTCTVNRS